MTDIILLPVVSEKAVALAEEGVYVFQVPQDASKIAIAQAVADQFKVKVKRVNTVNVKGKPKLMRTKRLFKPGRRSDYQKAYVTLEAGESIKLFEGAK